MLSGFHGSPDKFIGRVQTAHGFHHGIDGFVRQNFVKVLDTLSIFQRNLFQTQNLGDLHIRAGGDDLIHTFSHNTKAQQTNIHSFSSHIYRIGPHPWQDVPERKTLAFLWKTVYHIAYQISIAPKTKGFPGIFPVFVQLVERLTIPGG